MTFAQTDATVRITEDIREVTFTGTMPPELAVNLWEHNWISPITSCPSNRIPWNAIIAKLEEDTDMAKLMILRVLGQGLWEFDGVYKRAMSAPAWDLLREKYGYALDGDTVTVTREEVDAIPDAPAPLQLHLSEEDLEAIGNAAATGTANATADEIGSRLTGGN